MTAYTDRIKAIAPSYDPRHIEAFMRSEYGTLDHLSPAKFLNEVHLAIECIDAEGKQFAEKLAKSYGM